MATTLKSPAAHLETTRSTNRLKNCLICKHPPIPRSPYCPRPLVATTAERDEKRAVGVGLATRRFGDETLARGWSGEGRWEVAVFMVLDQFDISSPNSRWREK